MTTVNTAGRAPLTIVELEQPRCVNRFGSAPCAASGTPKCYQTYSTCLDKVNYDGTGSIKWRFTDGRPMQTGFGDFSDVDNIETNGIPCLVSVSTSASKINPATQLDGVSPLGVTGKVTVSLKDILWDDHVGDFYTADRAGYTAGQPLPTRGPFWALFVARNRFVEGMFLRIYDGYEGQALADMRQRVYVVDEISGPSGGDVTITGLDPLRLAKAPKFPTTSNLEISGEVTASQTSIQVYGDEADITKAFGNTALSYFSVNDEVISYSGYTDDGDGYFTLTGCERGAYDTTAQAHEDRDGVQRAGVIDKMKPWLIVNDLLQNHTPMPASFIPLADWNTEGETYLPTSVMSNVILEPTQVEDLIGQVTQQGLFYLWWSEYNREIKMLAIRPPSDAVASFTDEGNLLDGTRLTDDPSARLTRVAVHYEKRDIQGGDEVGNYKYTYVGIDDETENIADRKEKVIFADWLTSRTQAIQLAIRTVIRFRETPRFMYIRIDAKDREVGVGDLIDCQTRDFLGTEGGFDAKRWQVISASELEAGHAYMMDLQTYTYVGKFAVYMADGSPDYGAATDEQKANGAWYAEDDGTLDGTIAGYQYQ